jgi:alcohol dehydrogenase class IV
VTAATTGPRVIAGRGSAAGIAELLAGRRVFAVASAGTAQRTGLADWLPPGATLFQEFQPNPTAGQAMAAAAARSVAGADLVLGVGGGSALDVAKAARVLPADPARAAATIAGELACDQAGAAAELVLVPTTAGTGSEVTRFATLYLRGRKVSLDAPCVRADVAVVDPALTGSCPAPLTWSCAFDAVAHAIESAWSARATSESRGYAMAALALLVPVLRGPAGLPPAAGRDALSEAGTLAGRAIDITRTTAAHALAYPLTVHLGVPHGLACALNLTWLAPLVEPAWRGAAAAAVRDVLGVPAGGIGTGIAGLLTRRGLPVSLGAGCAPYLSTWLETPPRRAESGPGRDGGRALADVIVAEGLASDRMTGTPVELDRGLVRSSVARLLGGCDA